MTTVTPLPPDWLDRLDQISAAIDPTTPLQELLPATLERVLTELYLPMGWIFLRDETVFQVAADAGLSEMMNADDRSALRWSNCDCQQRLLNNSLNHVHHLIPCQRMALMRRQGAAVEADQPDLTHHIGYPLFLGSEGMGIMNLVTSQPVDFSPQQMRSVGLIANLLALAVGWAQQAEGSETQVRLYQLGNAIKALISAMAYEDYLQRSLEIAAELMNAQYGALALLDRNRAWSGFLHTGLPEGYAASMGKAPKGSGLLGLLLREGESLKLKDLTKHPESVGFPHNHPPMKSFLGVPILGRDGNPLGRLYMTNQKERGSFDDIDRTLLEMFSQSLAIAIELKEFDA